MKKEYNFGFEIRKDVWVGLCYSPDPKFDNQYDAVLARNHPTPFVVGFSYEVPTKPPAPMKLVRIHVKDRPYGLFTAENGALCKRYSLLAVVPQRFGDQEAPTDEEEEAVATLFKTYSNQKPTFDPFIFPDGEVRKRTQPTLYDSATTESRNKKSRRTPRQPRKKRKEVHQAPQAQVHHEADVQIEDLKDLAKELQAVQQQLKPIEQNTTSRDQFNKVLSRLWQNVDHKLTHLMAECNDRELRFQMENAKAELHQEFKRQKI